MLTAMAALPHGIWQAEHLDDLAQIIRDAPNATDLSHPTAQAMEQLVVHTFPFHPEWSANQLASIYRARGRVSVYRLDTYLSDAHVRSIAPVLTPILQSWQNHESEGLLLTLAIALGKRLSAFDELVDLLTITLAQTLSNYIADSILRLFLEHCHSRIYLLIPGLLRNDKSAITLSSVFSYLHRQRQDEAFNLLRHAPLAQVTVAKEVIRLIGELSSEAAYLELLSWDTRELHRDVRVALLRALWDYLEEPETWEIFTRAAQSPDTALARGLVHIPTDSMSSLIQRRLTTLTTTLLTHPAIEVRMATLGWRSQHPVTDHAHTLFPRLLALLNSPFPDECTLAARAVFPIYTGNDATLVGDAIKSLLSNRRALYIVCKTFSSAIASNRQQLQPTAQAILTALSQDRLTISLRVEIILTGLPWEEVAPELVRLANMLHISALIKAWWGIQQAAIRPDARLLELEMTLAASTDERLRMLALGALIAQSTQSSGWSDEAIARLENYRSDPSPLVAEAAQFTFVS